jgi:rubredoxin
LVWFWLLPTRYDRPSVFVCDSCNAEFEAVPGKDGRGLCPKCGRTEGVIPNYVRCPQCNIRLEGYRMRRTDPETTARAGARNEVKIPGKTDWIPDFALGPDGKARFNPAYTKALQPESWTCPQCKFTPTPGTAKTFTPGKADATP